MLLIQAILLTLTLTYYIYNNLFLNAKVSSGGSATPNITLAAENGKVVIFLDSKVYYQRLHIRAFATGMSETAAQFQGWTAVDSALLNTATANYAVPYMNRFAGMVSIDGNVGIGTTSTGTYKLAVEGTIGARRMQVKQTSWADFVFQQEYQLPPLYDVENYISINKHLSGIPTAEDVQKEGIDVGEMNKLLLQKVEELTLYIIDLKKQVDQIQSPRK